MRILAISDTELPGLYEYYNPQRTKGVDLIISCGDLHAKYLEFLLTVVNKPLLYVRGNHDTAYKDRPPEGCTCIDDRLILFNGLRILGLGGSMKYNSSPFMYTESEMKRRIRKMKWRLRQFGGVDIVVTHAPVYGYGDLDDLPHMGFECFNDLLTEYRPKYLLHGHVHKEYGNFQAERTHECGTEIINCYGMHILDIPAEQMPVLDEKNRKGIRRTQMFDRIFRREE
jgi:Icc-related predicted phosphoesterase